MNGPLLFLIFNRLDSTRRVFEVIRSVKPPRLYIAGDGPRSNQPGENETVKVIRNYVLDKIDWDCEVKTLFQEKNLGCRYAVSTGVDWFFENEEKGIILEDDCLPHPSFFRFCEELLDQYSNDKRIWTISGDNFQFGKRRTSESYYFSRHTHIWGWASWRRTWQMYDVKMEKWPMVKNNGWLNDILLDRKQVKYWHDIFESVYKGKIDTWDYQLTFACWINSAVNILPNSNLVSNIGFGDRATHTTRVSRFSNMPVSEMTFPLKHPPIIVRDSLNDRATEFGQFNKSFIVSKLINYFIQALSK